MNQKEVSDRLIQLFCKILGITEERFDSIIAEHGYDCDIAAIVYIEDDRPLTVLNDVSGLQRLIENSNPDYSKR